MPKHINIAYHPDILGGVLESYVKWDGVSTYRMNIYSNKDGLGSIVWVPICFCERELDMLGQRTLHSRILTI